MIVVIPYSLESHIKSSFGFFDILSQAYQVTYCVPHVYFKLVSDYGFSTYELGGMPFGYGLEYQNRVNFENSSDAYLDSLMDRITNRLYKDREERIMKLLKDLTPTVVVIDMFSSTDFIILYKYCKINQIKICFFQSTLSTYRRPNALPISSFSSSRSKLNLYLEWNHVYFNVNFRRLIDFIKYFGRDNHSMIVKMFNRNEIPAKFKISNNNFYNVAFDNLNEFILAPEELEYTPNYVSNNQYYCGSIIKVNSDINDPLNIKLNKIFSLKLNNNYKIIYFAMGSLNNFFRQKILNFLKKISIIAKNNLDWHFICSVDKDILKDFDNNNSNIYLFDKVDQLFVLKYSDAFISHGGLGSIKESLHFEVPILVYPLSKLNDPDGNSKKVDYYNLGIAGSIKYDSVTTIENKIKQVLFNPFYKNNIKKFNQSVNTNPAYDAEKILLKFLSIECL